MQTQQIEQNEVQVLSLGESISQVLASYNADVIEQNQLVDDLGKSEQENTFLKMQLSNLSKRLDVALGDVDRLTGAIKEFEVREKDFNKKADKVTESANQHMQMLDQANREKAQMKAKLDDAILTVASYKQLGSPKQIRVKNKGYQDRAAKYVAAETQHKIEVNKYRHAITKAENEVKEITYRLREIDMTEAYNENGDHLWLFPKVMQIPSRGMTGKEISFLYLNDDGRGCLMTLDDDGEIVLGKAPIRPKATTKEHASMMLRKFKKNGWTIQVDDLQVMGG